MLHEMTKDECKEGQQEIPKNWTPCCELFDYHTKVCQYEVRVQWSKGIGWGMPILDGGSSQIKIKYCPWCSSKLKDGDKKKKKCKCKCKCKCKRAK